MVRFHPVASVCLAVAIGLSPPAHAQEVSKWKDANGKVHYGDRAVAPDESKKMDIKISQPSRPAALTMPEPGPGPGAEMRPGPQLPPPTLPRPEVREKSVPVAASRVGPACKGLIDKIAAVPSGKNWQSLYQEFNSACPRIAYECTEFKSRPQDNKCLWIERSGNNVLRTNIYP